MDSMTIRRVFSGAIVAAAACGAACGGNSNSSASTQPTIIASPTPETWEGELAVGGSAFDSFTVNTDSSVVDVMLASVMTGPAFSDTSDVVLGLAIGTPLGTDCNVMSAVLGRAALQSPIAYTVGTKGIYCIRVYDVGNLTTAVNFAIRIVHR